MISRAMDAVTKSVHDSDTEHELGDDDDATSDDQLATIEGPVINDGLIRFKLASPSPMPSYLNVHFICETASRLLFLSVHWVRSIPAFSLLR